MKQCRRPDGVGKLAKFVRKNKVEWGEEEVTWRDEIWDLIGESIPPGPKGDAYDWQTLCDDFSRAWQEWRRHLNEV